MADDKDMYSFYRISDLVFPLRIKISSLVGKLERHPRLELLDHPELSLLGSEVSDYPDLYVEFRLYADNKPLTPVQRTAYRSIAKEWNWSEYVTFPWNLSELPLNAQIGFTIYDTAGPNKQSVVGGTTFRLFGKRGALRKTQHRLFVWRSQPADGSAESSTPSKIGAVQDEMGRVEKLIKKLNRGDIDHVDWMDPLTMRKAASIYRTELEHSSNLFLNIEMPFFNHPVVFCEPEPEPIVMPPLHTHLSLPGVPVSAALAGNATPIPHTGGAEPVQSKIDPDIFTVVDPEIVRESPIEAKHRRMTRQHRSGPLDREMKPNAAVRDRLNAILSYPPTRSLTEDEMNLVWSFRFYLTRDPKGLTKFLKSVSWSDPGEAKQATEVLLPLWSQPAVDDALELLGPTFKDIRVREYAVQILEGAQDEELMLYLLQLVQAIKFDHLALQSSRDASAEWNREDSTGTMRLTRSSSTLRKPHHSHIFVGGNAILGEKHLAEFLIRRAVSNAELGNFLYWYVFVETTDKGQGHLYTEVKTRLLDCLATADETGVSQGRCEGIKRQTLWMEQLAAWAVELRLSKESRPKKIDRLRSWIADSKSGFAEFHPLMTLPLDPRIQVGATLPEKSTVFKSNQLPLLLCLRSGRSSDNNDKHSKRRSSLRGKKHSEPLDSAQEEVFDHPSTVSDRVPDKPLNYPVIFKNGDDLRQDQLVIQLFTLMDQLLQKENLDLKLTPYRVLATGPEDGLVQFVKSQSIASISSEYSTGGPSVQAYLRQFHANPNAEYGIEPSVLDTFIRSCAGYCVITYLLGVGDRHLDNLLVAPDGHFFHVDFAYILGRDPKPYPPPVKVCREMVDCMGGPQSAHYHRFKSLCFTAFVCLRKSANLILNLIALMVDANVRDIQREPDRAVWRVQENFVLTLNDAEAIQHLDRLLSESSYIVAVMDKVHDWAQMLRA